VCVCVYIYIYTVNGENKYSGFDEHNCRAWHRSIYSIDKLMQADVDLS